MRLVYSSKYCHDLKKQVEFFRERGRFEGNYDLPFEFIEEIERTIARIQAHPNASPKVTQSIRKTHLDHFSHHSVRYYYDRTDDTLYCTLVS